MKIITMYELLGLVKDEPDRSIYVKYFDRVNKKEDVMWACKENIIYKLDQLVIELNDKVEILEEEKKIPEKLETYKEVDDEDYFANILKVSENGECEIDEATSVIVDKINLIIDYLKSKGDE